MDKSKKLGRGLEDVSYLFLSSSPADPSNNAVPEASPTPDDPSKHAAPETSSFPADPLNNSAPDTFSPRTNHYKNVALNLPSSPVNSSPKPAHDSVEPISISSEAPVVFGIFCCLTLEIKSFFLCNLALEIAKFNQTVSVIDFGLTYPSVRYLMGNLVDLQDNFPTTNTHQLDFKVESIKLYGFSKIFIFSLGVSLEQVRSKNIIEKIFADERVRNSHIVLVNSTGDPDNFILPKPFSHLQKSMFIMDSQIQSLLETYSWIKKLSPFCQNYLIGTIVQEGKDIFLSRQHMEKLDKIAQKYIAGDFNILTTLDIPIDQEAIDSIKLRRPLALLEPTSASGKAMANLCKNLLEKK